MTDEINKDKHGYIRYGAACAYNTHNKVSPEFIDLFGDGEDIEELIGSCDSRSGNESCVHEFIPLFNSIVCKRCGIDRDKVND